MISTQLKHDDTLPWLPSSAGLGVPEFSARALDAKRLVDVAVATAAVMFAIPLLFLIAVTVALTSSGPVLFRQQRVGRDGVPFTMLKFRTMQDGTHEMVRSDPAMWRTFVANDFKLDENHSQNTRFG